MVRKKGLKNSKRFNISNRLSYTIIAVFAVILLATGVYALYSVRPGVTPNPGHTLDGVANQIAPPSGCAGGQFLQWNYEGGNEPYGYWSCADVTTSSGIQQPSSCASGTFLKWTGSAWICEALAPGTTITSSLSLKPVNTGVTDYAYINPLSTNIVLDAWVYTARTIKYCAWNTDAVPNPECQSGAINPAYPAATCGGGPHANVGITQVGYVQDSPKSSGLGSCKYWTKAQCDAGVADEYFYSYTYCTGWEAIV
jgi:hypothetical protein